MLNPLVENLNYPTALRSPQQRNKKGASKMTQWAKALEAQVWRLKSNPRIHIQVEAESLSFELHVCDVSWAYPHPARTPLSAKQKSRLITGIEIPISRSQNYAFLV